MSDQDNQTSVSILLVNDDEIVLDSLKSELKGGGYAVSTAVSGSEAMELARERHFDLVLCDFYLEGMNGIQFTQALSRMHPQLPVVVMTAWGDVEASHRSLEAGACDVVTKPLELERLPLILRENLQRKRIEQKKLHDERADVLFKTIKAIAAAIDGKSRYTDTHSARMAEYCVEIGRRLSLDEHQLLTLELAAHIHDVGKIATPDTVLMKPGRLSEDEWIDVLKHPSIGASFLDGIGELDDVAAIIRHHHERIDGTGYPDGLKGEAIPFLARILCVADAFEAMTSDRPYREALSWQMGIAELRLNSGTQFDPQVVEAAAYVMTEIFEEPAARERAA